jgi:hypothetical protein
MTPSPQSVEQFLSAYPTPVQRLAQLARQRIVGVVPEAKERVRTGWKLIGYNAPAYFAFIAPQQDHVRIGFEWGIALPDPTGLLEGSGSQVRHVSIHAARALERPALAELLRAAAALRPPPRDRSLA